MKDRIENILTLTAARNIATCKGFEEAKEKNTYWIDSDLSDLGHRIRLWYEASDEFIRVEITCIFGNFDFSQGVSSEDLLKLLAANYPSFENSCAYLAAVADERISKTLHISLQTSQVFLVKWSDEDIAHALAVKFFDLLSGLMFSLGRPVKTFGE